MSLCHPASSLLWEGLLPSGPGEGPRGSAGSLGQVGAACGWRVWQGQQRRVGIRALGQEMAWL